MPRFGNYATIAQDISVKMYANCVILRPFAAFQEEKTVIKILFVCHGNICRSTMAEFIFKNLVKEKGLEASFEITSAGVSAEEEGNDIYPPAKRELRSHNIPFTSHYAHRITDKEFEENDLVIALDSSNMRSLLSRFGKHDKIRMLLQRDVDDPWYTGDFDIAYRDITEGCLNLLSQVVRK